MNIDQIKTFLAVYRTKSFVEVAKEQNVAPSSISRSIAMLESILKTRLFQRTTRNLTATQAGEIYFKKMEPLIEEIDLVNQSLINSTAQPSGLLRITSSVSYGQAVIAPILTEFQKKYPDIQLELILSDSRIDIINDQIDIAIRHGALPDSNLIARKLTDVQYKLVSSKGYLDKFGIPQEPEDLKSHNLVTFTYDGFKHNWVFKNNYESKKIAIQPVLTTTNALAIQQSIYKGLGIALLADWTVSEGLKSGELVELFSDWKISGETTETAIWLVYPSNKFIPAKTKAFANFLLAEKDNIKAK